MVKHGDNIGEAFFDYFFHVSESYWGEPHDYPDEMLQNLSHFYERLRNTYATPDLYLYRLQLLGLADLERIVKDIAFAWDSTEVATRIAKIVANRDKD